jgi:alpha-L-rhamnosidase
MVRWLDRTQRLAAAGRHPSRTGPVRPRERYLWDTGFHWGEWLEPGDDMSGPFEEFAGRDKSDVATAYYARSADLMSRIAAVLGRGPDSARYAELAASVRASWQAEFIGADGEVRPATQANIVRALTFGLLPGQLRERAAAQLVRLIREAGTHLGTGFLATADLLPALADAGHPGLAYELLFRDTPPSCWTLDAGPRAAAPGRHRPARHDGRGRAARRAGAGRRARPSFLRGAGGLVTAPRIRRRRPPRSRPPAPPRR